MRWTDPRRRAVLVALTAALALGTLSAVLFSAEEKRLSVNVENGLYFVVVLDKEAGEYVDVRELLQPLGEVTLRRRENKVRLRAHGRELEFAHGEASFQSGGKRSNL